MLHIFHILVAHAATFVPINPNVPGVDASGGPVQIIYNLYRFLLGMGGVIALGAVIYGAVQYAASAGNIGNKSEGRDWITSALLGLLLLALAYIILHTINPDLTNLQLYPLSAPGAPGGPSGQAVFACENNSDNKIRGSCYPTQAECENNCPRSDVLNDSGEVINPAGHCVAVSSACTASTTTSTPSALQCASGRCVPINIASWSVKNGNQVDPVMLTELQCINAAGHTLQVTDAMPPSSAHESGRHSNGCAIDATIQPPLKSSADCTKLSALERAITSCGGSYLNEYVKLCNGTQTKLGEGDHIHIAAACGG